MSKDLHRYFKIEARELHERLVRGALALERELGDDEMLRDLRRAAHTLKGAASVVGCKDIAASAHGIEDTLAGFEAQRGSDAVAAAAAVDAVLATLDTIAAAIDALGSPSSPAASPARPPSASQVPPPPAASPTPPPVSPSPLSSPSAASLAPPPVAPSPLSSPPPAASVAAPPARATAERRDQIGVAAAELAAMRAAAVDVAAALRRAHALAGACASTTASVGAAGDELMAVLETSEREVDGLLRRLTRLQIVPAADVFLDLERGLRDVAQGLGRQARLLTSGGETRVDAEVLARLRAPLQHLVRNAVDHGIEAPDARVRAGKPAQGVVRFDVSVEGHTLVLRMADDGRGIDLSALREVAAGSLGAAGASALSELEVLETAFADGVSSAQAVTEFSGRGVGLAAVRAVCSGLRGSARLLPPEGQGCVVELRVPVSLSSRDVVEIVVGERRLLLPLEAVVRVVAVDAAAVERRLAGTALIEGERALPFVALDGLLSGVDVVDTGKVAVIVAASGGAVALGVGGVVGRAHVTILPLPGALGPQPIVIGAALDAHGHPTLLLNVEQLAQQARRLASEQRPARTQKVAPSLLVIDDSLTTRMLEQTILESAGYRVTLAVDAEQGLTLARKGKFDMILVDVEMPGMNGFEFVEACRRDPKLADVPIAMVTTLAKPEHRLRGLEAGAQAYIVKSEFEEGSYLDTIRGLVG